jgi:asparagine synthase (glutamine-hydrolysing)
MCGICGYITTKDINIASHVLDEMTDALSHRGPDDRGVYAARSKAGINIGLGHRRLSIIDLSQNARQPMSNEDGSVWLVFNGEIYNFRDLKPQLLEKGHKFKSAGDTEVIIHLYEEYGEECLKFINGMFAFALWDSRHNILFAARDRIGEKPFYYTDCNGTFVFASELKSIVKYPYFNKELDYVGLSKYLAYEYIPAPLTIFKGVRKLPAGSFLKWQGGIIEVKKYWDLDLSKSEKGFSLSESESLNKLRALLLKSVERRLISDVPLGLFLSGGIDSSIVLSLMAEFMECHKIKTFTIGFEDKSFDESGYARDLAHLFGTEHKERIFTSADLLEHIPMISQIMDEPLADASIVPTYLLSRFTRQHVKVALGGDGGDELFAGYPTFQADKFIDLLAGLPIFAKKSLLAILEKSLSVSFGNISLDFKIKQLMRGSFYPPLTRHFVWIGSFTPEMQSCLLKEPLLKTAENIYSDISQLSIQTASARKRFNSLLYLYTKLYLQNDILTKVDTASMANSLEVRAPYLDTELLNFVETIPYNFKIRLFKTKYILKKAFIHKLPRHILKRPKKGFGIPIAIWLRSELKVYLRDCLSHDALRKTGVFNPKFVDTLIDEHLSAKRDNRKLLWTLLVFQQWHNRFF